MVSTTTAVMVKHERLVSNPQVFLAPHKSPDMCQAPGPIDPNNLANMHYILQAGAIVYFRKKFTSDGIIILRSSTIDLFNSENTDINLHNASGQVVLHISLRRDENVIVFNTYRDNHWEVEERVGFEGNFTSEDGHIELSPSITICDHEDRFQVMINYRTIHYFKKRFLDNAAAVSYNSSHKPLFSDILDVDVYPSLANLLQVTRDNSI